MVHGMIKNEADRLSHESHWYSTVCFPQFLSLYSVSLLILLFSPFSLSAFFREESFRRNQTSSLTSLCTLQTASSCSFQSLFFSSDWVVWYSHCAISTLTGGTACHSLSMSSFTLQWLVGTIGRRYVDTLVLVYVRTIEEEEKVRNAPLSTVIASTVGGLLIW